MSSEEAKANVKESRAHLCKVAVALNKQEYLQEKLQRDDKPGGLDP